MARKKRMVLANILPIQLKDRAVDIIYIPYIYLTQFYPYQTVFFWMKLLRSLFAC